MDMQMLAEEATGKEMPVRCAECGALAINGETCANRFSLLLALDHSREEPWGSRHGLAFAVYTLQHPNGLTNSVLANCWLMLNRVYVHGDDRTTVVRGVRGTYRSRHGKSYRKLNAAENEPWLVAPFPVRENPLRAFAVTIADLGDFTAQEYPELLDAWCMATLNAWSLSNE